MEGLSQDRDDLDFTLCRKFIEERKPILAVGRRMQVVNVALGGTLCSDINNSNCIGYGQVVIVYCQKSAETVFKEIVTMNRQLNVWEKG